MATSKKRDLRERSPQTYFYRRIHENTRSCEYGDSNSGGRVIHVNIEAREAGWQWSSHGRGRKEEGGVALVIDRN
jgi:hypothetical protein